MGHDFFPLELNREKVPPPLMYLLFFADYSKLRFELDKLDFNLLRDLYRSRDHVCDVKNFLLSLFIRQKYTTLATVREGLDLEAENRHMATLPP